ncbi:MAG: hypothetical protein RhofKO_18210 [Rhodothermales bacterium]
MPQLYQHPTPNPNSIKITTDGAQFLDSGLESFSTASEAEGHPLGAALFQVRGVQNVLILPDFLTITKAPAANWSLMWEAIQEALQAHLGNA